MQNCFRVGEEKQWISSHLYQLFIKLKGLTNDIKHSNNKL